GGKEPNVSTNAVPTFTDVRGTSAAWAEGYIESCVAQGIVSGVGGGRFAPDGNVTGSQLAKMLLVALGYNSDNEGFTGNAWETNVNVRASQKGLYAGLETLDTSAAVTRDQAAQMVWNALNAYEVEYKTTLVTDANGQLVSQVTVQDKVGLNGKTKVTLLEDKYEAKTFTGTFNGNSDCLSLKDGQIQVYGSVSSDIKDANANFTYDFDLSYIGEEVKVLFKDGIGGTDNKPDDKDTIYGVVVTGDTTVLNVTSDDIKSAADYATAGKIKVSGTEYDVVKPTAGQVLVVTNYGAVADATSADAKRSSAKAAFSALSGQNGNTVKFILNDDGEVAKAYVQTYTLGTVTAVNSEKITISGLGSIKIADSEIYDGVAKDDVVVYSKLYKRTLADATVVVTKAEMISGTVTGYKGNENVTVDGTVYKIYNKVAMPTSVAGETGEASFATGDIGETFDFYLVNGYVAAAVQTSETATNYSLVIDVNGGTLGATLDPMKAVVLAADGTKTTLTLSDKGDAAVLGDIVTWTGSADNAKLNVEAAKSGAVSNTTTTGYDKTSKTFNGVVTSADCVLFKDTDKAFASITKTDSYKAYNIRDMKDFPVITQAYTFVKDDDNKIVAVFVGNDTATSGSTSDAVIGIVSASNGVVEFDDVEYNQYTVVSNETTYTVNIEENGGTDDSLTKGNIVAFAPTTDDLYDDNTGFVVLSAAKKYIDQKKNIDGTDYIVSTVWVKNYDESEALLSYYTAKGTKDGDGAYTAPTGLTTKAVADDVTIVYVDVDNDTAGDAINVNAFDAMTGYANAIILVDGDGVISHIVVETSNEANIFA
ncbi:MAG TPA: S-layer homology domain-containing protein, partial [Candidatus Evtepia faecigallinarum]|nr:S-layer homology domain-containing protein [Candidatus Evtepia faecigallinarum]